MDLRLLVLALGTFAIGTGSFVFAGLLGDVAGDLSVSVGTAGQLITVYAIVYAVGSPVLVTVTGAVARRRLLVLSLAVFAGANVAAVVLSSFGPLLASRIVAACAAAVFTPTTAVVAASLVTPEKRGRALATVTGGLTIAFAFGIPLGTLVGEYFGWRAAFVLVGVLGAIAVAGIAALLPVIENPPPVSLRDRMLAVEQPAVVAALGLTAIGLGSGFVVFTYVDPLLGDLTGFGGRGISGMLLLFGLAAIAGNALGGYGADRWGYGRSMVVIFVVVALSLLSFSLLTPVAGSLPAVVGAGVALVTWSVAGWAITPFQQYRLIELAPHTQNIVLSLNASAIYLGQGVGAGIGALVILYGSFASLGWVAALCTAVGFVVLLSGARSHGGGPDEEHPG
ncbi:MAG: MFS transporter [Rubrobacter sp.]|nr:MFS transporter [Rubrobacter sp.]MDQ3639036.1 MFS transporter [Actinomycetota bacterium]